MHIYQLNYLLIINQERNLSRAAEKCFVTESALSQFIGNLERSCGLKLFFRAKNVMTPTAAGMLYIEAAQKIVDTYESLQQDIEKYKCANNFKIKLGMTTERSERIFPFIFNQFHSQYPEIKLQLINDRYESSLERLAESKLNMVLAAIPEGFPLPNSSLFFTKPLFTEDLVLIVSPSHPFAVWNQEHPKESLPLFELDDEPFIGFEENMVLHWYSSTIFEQIKIRPNEILHVGSINTGVEFVKKGIGFSIVPRYLIPADKSPSICIIPTSPQLKWTHNVIYLKKKPLTIFERYIMQLISDGFQSLAREKGSIAP
ncbi:MAG: LysR family transcriptional regulator [Clostridium sp.]|nr:LysR family transcriptional regulator [Clostridium sp.]